mmetsp:Transcript_12777/g.57665  ORF Transcript_12777/g.57665 Transcript_12777/m.57665 type:complete len:421 (-) Transcript_12777:24-1286(-)
MLLRASLSQWRLQPFLPRQLHLPANLRHGRVCLIRGGQQQTRRQSQNRAEVPAAQRNLQPRHPAHQRRRVHLQQRRRAVQQHRDVDERDVSVQARHRRLHPSRIPKHASPRRLRHRPPALAAAAPEVPEAHLQIVRAGRGALERAPDRPLTPALRPPVTRRAGVLVDVHPTLVDTHPRLDARGDGSHRTARGGHRLEASRPGACLPRGVGVVAVRRRREERLKVLRGDDVDEIRGVAVFLPQVHQKPRGVARREVVERRGTCGECPRDAAAVAASVRHVPRRHRGLEEAVQRRNLREAKIGILEERRGGMRGVRRGGRGEFLPLDVRRGGLIPASAPRRVRPARRARTRGGLLAVDLPPHRRVGHPETLKLDRGRERLLREAPGRHLGRLVLGGRERRRRRGRRCRRRDAGNGGSRFEPY